MPSPSFFFTSFVHLSVPRLSPTFHRPPLRGVRRSRRKWAIPLCVGASPPAATPPPPATTPSTDDTQSQTQSLQADLTAPTPPPFRLHPSDVLVLALFFASFLLPALRGSRPPRAHAVASAALFAAGSALYVLRQRSVHRTWRERTLSAMGATNRVAAYLQESRTNAVNSDRNMQRLIERSDRARDKQHAVLLRAFRTDLDELQAGFSLVQDALREASSEQLADARNALRERDVQIGRLSAQLDDARTATDAAIAREAAARVELDALRTTASEVSVLRERLLSAQTRSAALEERVARAQDAAITRTQQPPQNEDAPQLPGGSVLRDALLNLGKSFPPAGRLLFDSAPNPSSPRRNEDSSPISQALSWPDAPLGAPNTDLGLPKDGGFGTDHYANGADDSAAAAADPFSTLRGAFNDDGSAALPQAPDGGRSFRALGRTNPGQSDTAAPKPDGVGTLREENPPVEEQRLEAPPVADPPQEALSDPPNDEDASGALREEEEASANEYRPDAASVAGSTQKTLTDPVAENDALGDEETVDEPALSEKTAALDADSTLSDEKAIVEEQALSNKSTEDAADDALNETKAPTEEQELSDNAVAVDGNGVLREEKAPVEDNAQQAGSERMQPTRTSKVRDMVRRARSSTAEDAERLFASAVELLEAAPGGGRPLDAELGATLLAWARSDIGATAARGRLERAATLLRTAYEGDSAARFNLALTLCMLASLERAPRCAPLYEEACTHYDVLVMDDDTRTRTVCFNGGLAYVSRARLAEDDDTERGETVVEMYRMAQTLFERAIECAPDDAKSQAYVDECAAKVAEASKML